MKNAPSQLISQKNQNLIEKLLLGKFSLSEIAKVTGISEQFLHTYVKGK